MTNNGGRTKKVLGILCSGIGLMTDLYDFRVLNVVKPLLEQSYGHMTPNQKGLLTASALFGAVIGQLFFGIMADKVGRRTMFLCTASFTSLGSLLSAVAWNFGENGIYWNLIIFRFVMGFGIGGEYPISASHTAESSDAASSGSALALVYSCMGFGQVFAPLLVWVLLVLKVSKDFIWRVAFGVGAALSIFGLILRLCLMEDSDRFKKAQKEHKTPMMQVARRYWKPLLGTCMSWFLYDFVDYGLGLYADELTSLTVGGDDAAVTLNCLIYQVIGLPSFFLSVWLIGNFGRKETQLLGFTGMLVTFIVIVVAYPWLQNHGWAFVLLYGLQLSFDNMGPGASCYTIPGEIFPTAVRASAHGLSAASGKSGAVVGTYVVPYMVDADGFGVRWTLAVMGLVCALCILWTIVFTPRYDQRTLEELEQKDKEESDRAVIEWLYGGAHRAKALSSQ